MWCKFSTITGQSRFTCFASQILEGKCHLWYQNFSNHAKLKLKIFIYVPRSIVKRKFEVAMWPYFPTVTQPIRHFYLTMPNFQLGDYSWHSSISIHKKLTPLKFIPLNYIVRPLRKMYRNYVISLSLLTQSHISFFTIANFYLNDYLDSQVS